MALFRNDGLFADVKREKQNHALRSTPRALRFASYA